MKTTYIIIAAIVVIIIIIGGVFAYISLSSSSTPLPTPTPIATATPTSSPTSSPTASPTSHPTSAPTPSAAPTAVPTPTPTATPTPTPAPLAAATINGGGGTLVAPLMSVWQGAYGSAEPQITVNYNAEGSGAGITDFKNQVVNFGESDAPMTAAQYTALPSGTTAITVPISASAVVPGYNLKLVNGSVCQNGLNFTGSVLANIFLGTVTTWNDPSIQALQSPAVAAQLPNTPIITVHRSDGSGTMFAFSNFLSDASSQFKTTIGESTTPNWVSTPGGTIAAPKNAGVAGAISQNNGAIGPLEIAYILENTGQTSLYYGTVQNAAGNFILANVANIAAALTAGASTGLPAGSASWTTVSIVDNVYTNTSATTAYPIATLTYMLIYQNQSAVPNTNAAQAAALVNFISWIVNSGQSLGSGLGYVPLPANIVAVDNTSLDSVTYNGTPII
ncbi:MAG TPA: phosphate ABC transporter substrate-binding protein PstS [Candidatus Acidoferrum sp.]|nr:phosphate ABC transporter substrate-binding protein PstS [Candidatus Acidoferrum sp.]